MKKNATSFAVAGASLIALFFGIVNYMLTPGVLWCIYPVYAVLWWPLGVHLCAKKKHLAFALAGSLITIVFLALVNYVTSPGTLWFVYAVPPLLCWPVAVRFREKLLSLAAAIALSAFIIVYYLALNLLLAPGYFWAIYPIYFALWWPLSLYLNTRGKHREFSIAGSVITIAFLIAQNHLQPGYPWAWYACYPLIWWPLAMYFGKKLGGLRFSILASICTVLWYGALNLLLAPGSPWIMFIVYALLWWPLSVYFAGRKAPHWYAAVMTAISILFFAAVNLVYSPGALWAHYPVYALLWWPLTLFFARKHAWVGYAASASLLTIAFLGFTNYLTSPGYPWFIYPSLVILWWPLSAFYAKHKSTLGFSVSGGALTIATLVIINALSSPGFLWSIFPSICVLWWPLSVFFARKGRPFLFSILGSLLVIGLLGAINLMASPGFLWFLFPAFAVIWWPLGVYFGQAKKRSGGGKIGISPLS